jgi:glycosyltransferase involved in cell wall biosynthesis
MRVIQISPYSIRKVGGVATSIIDLCREFNRKKTDFVLVTPAVENDSELDSVFEPNQNYFELKAPKAPFTANLGIARKIFRLLLKSRGSIDVVHLYTIKSSTAIAALAARILNKPVVTTIYVIQPPPEGLLRRMAYSLSTTAIFHLTTRFAYETRVAKQQCGNRPGMVIPEGIDVNYFKPNLKLKKKVRERLGIPEDSFVMLYSGRLVENKGIHELLDAVSSLPENIRNRFKLLVIGNFESRALMARFRDRKSMPWLIHKPPVGRDAIKSFYCAADSFVLPSYIEGISSSLIEAMACGLAPVVTNVGGNVEVVDDGKNGLVVEPRDVSDLRGAVEQLFKNTGMRKELAGEARLTVVNNFSLEKKSQRYINIYEKSMKVSASLL